MGVFLPSQAEGVGSQPGPAHALVVCHTVRPQVAMSHECPLHDSRDLVLFAFCYTELPGTCRCSLCNCGEYEGISLFSSVKALGPHTGKPTPVLL